jgi:dienelactone hydrolase
MLPGVTGTKEELHAFAMPLLRRGIAVARIDHPVYGETEGIVDSVTVHNPRLVLEALARDPRLDAARLFGYGMSLGSNFLLQSTPGSPAAGVLTICPPYQPGAYAAQLPSLNLSALMYMTMLPDMDALVRFAHDSSLVNVAPRITVPVRIFHGGRDRTIPVGDAHLLRATSGGPSALTVYERDHHNCLEHIDEITAHALAFVDDPIAACQSVRPQALVNTPPSQHATDADAKLAGAGFEPGRAAARLPFLLPWARPRPHGS